MANRAPLTRDEDLLAVPSPPTSSIAGGGDKVRLARVHAELEAGFEALAGIERAVSVFGSARTPPGDPDYELAREVAARVGRDGNAIITGGGPGIMEAANRGARDVSALSVGLTIELPHEQRANDYLDIPQHFQYVFTRKAMFVRYASAFVVFPGGFGTLDELFELVMLIQTGKVSSPPVVLVRRSYWDPLLAWLRDTVLAAGKISPEDLGLLALADDADEVQACVGAALGRT
jgi:uncharacterized protein (TIGR00730 family)